MEYELDRYTEQALEEVRNLIDAGKDEEAIALLDYILENCWTHYCE